MNLTINSRVLGREVHFSRPGGGYLWVDLGGMRQSDDAQMCHGGKLLGSTMAYSGDDKQRFDKICRAWFRLYLKKNKWMGE